MLYARGAKGVTTVSMSWGTNEFSNESAYDSLFTTTLGHKPVTFVAASGDQGSWYGPDWPAISSNVLSVGGTTLSVQNSSGTYGNETGWSGSGGGISQFESEPAYQTIAQLTGAATSPDVAYDANPNTGFAVYDSVAYQGSQGWWEMGGTSAGTPQWAALIAIADQGRVLNGLPTLNGGSQTLPLLFSLYNSTQYYQAYHDQVFGGSSWFDWAQPGYDLVTGLGSPQAAFLIQQLIGAPAAGAQTAVMVRGNFGPTIRTTMGGFVMIGHPTPPAIPTAPATAANVVPEISPPAGNASPALKTTIGSATSFDAIGGSTLETGRTQAAAGSTSSLVIHAISDGKFQTSRSNISGRRREGTDAFSTIQLVSDIDREIDAAAGIFTAARTMSTVGAASTDVVEDLLISNASALANVANTLAVRLYEEDVAIWKDTTTLIVAGVIVGTHLMRTRRTEQVPAKKRKNEEFLCVGE